MRKLFLLVRILSMLAFAGTAIAEDLTIFGITLGQSATENYLKECKKSNFANVYDHSDSSCYKLACWNGDCFLKYSLGLSFRTETFLHGQMNKEVILNEPIEEIQVSFHTDYYNNMFSALKNKFGKPASCWSNIRSNRMGGKFIQQICIWVIGDNKIRLYNMKVKIDDGLLLIHSEKRIQKDLKKSQKKFKEDSSKF